MKKILPVLFVAGLMMSACAPKTSELIGTWKLTAYGPANFPQPAAPNVNANLNFDTNGKLNGNAGCNNLGGDYKVSGDQITFGPIMSTMMACADPQMTQESAVVQVLTDTASFKVEGNTLTITNKDMVLVLVK